MCDLENINIFYFVLEDSAGDDERGEQAGAGQLGGQDDQGARGPRVQGLSAANLRQGRGCTNLAVLMVLGIHTIHLIILLIICQPFITIINQTNQTVHEKPFFKHHVYNSLS